MAEFDLSLSMVDDYGRTTRKVIEMVPQVLLADMVLEAQAYVDALEDVTDLSVVRADIIVKGAVSGFSVTAGANVDVGATFSGFITDGDGKKASLKVPGFKAGLVSGDGTVDITQVVVDTYLDEYVSPGNGARISDGETISEWIKGSLDK
jgi:hypothetical protein